MTTSIKRLPLTVQTVYADLLDRLQEEALSAHEGTPVLRQRRGRKYWYTVKRLADRSVERYLGPDTEDLRAKIARIRKASADLKERQRQNVRLTRICREGGLPGLDAQSGRVLSALSKAGIFRLRGVLIGTHAFRCYPGLLGTELPPAHAVTEDIDLAAFHSVSVALDDRLDPLLAQALEEIGPFIARPSLYPQPTAWRDRESDILVELLTPNEGPDRDEPLELPALGAFAKPLRFLDYLIHAPIQAAALYRSGILVNLPQPARYGVHKLIVATRRAVSAASKAGKDIEQAAALIRILGEDRPDELEEAFAEAQERGPAWRAALARGARRLPDDARTVLAKTVGERFEQ